MNRQQHRLGVTEENLVVRNLKLESYVKTLLQQAMKEIDGFYGIDDVSFDKKSKTLSLAYDASKIDIDSIEKVLENNRVEVSHDWWTRFKESYYRFVDTNVKDNASSQPHCCNKIPPEAKRK